MWERDVEMYSVERWNISTSGNATEIVENRVARFEKY